MLKALFCSERNMMALIVINAIVITLLYFPSLQRVWPLETIDRIITILFILEATVKIAVLGVRGYFAKGWNRFDFFLVLISTPSIFVGLLPLPDMSFWLMLRLFRLGRMVRLIEFVPHIDQLLTGLGRALRASFLVLMVLAFGNYMLAMWTCHIFGSLEPDLFGDPFSAMYTMFQVFTVEGWNEIPLQVADKIKEGELSLFGLPVEFTVAVVKTFFATTLLLGGVFGLSLANAIFVDEMTIDNNDQLEKKIDCLQQQIETLQTTIDSINRSLRES